jgi:hypothetical protein
MVINGTVHRMWGELRRCEPAPHPPREGPRHVSGWGSRERHRSQFLSVRCVRESVEHCAVHFAQCSLRVVDCASAVTATRIHDLSNTDPQVEHAQRALWHERRRHTRHRTDSGRALRSLDSGPPRRAAAAGGAAPAPARVPFRYAHAWIWYRDCERHVLCDMFYLVPPKQASELSELPETRPGTIFLTGGLFAPPESKKLLEEGRLGMVATDSSAMATMVAKK